MLFSIIYSVIISCKHQKKQAFNLTLVLSKDIIFSMNSLENSLQNIAESILHFDEASLTSKTG
ncbi:MAG: hypothetical protein STSR0002_01300 [Smithella sp.]